MQGENRRIKEPCPSGCYVPADVQYKDDTVSNIESVLAPPAPKPPVQPTQLGKEAAPAKKKVVRAYNRQVVFQAKTLQTDADIDDYVEKIRSQLKQLLKNCDEIKLN